MAQVLSSPNGWQMASLSATVRLEGIVGVSTGHHSMKGITRSVELFSCTAPFCVGEGAAGGARR
jgi:hypothetical protein